MGEHKTVILHWKGPFSFEEIESRSDMGCGVYLATGKLRHKKTKDIQYCGITERSFLKRLKNHHKVNEINREQEFWFAEIVYPRKHSRTLLELAESIIIYFWQPTLNDRKKLSQPRQITLVNHWFKKDGSPRRNQHPMCKDLKDVLCWDGELWRTGNLNVCQD